MKKAYLLVFLAISLLGCGRTINYSLNKGEYYEATKTCLSSLTVLTFNDIRKQPELKWHSVEMDGKKFKYNVNGMYTNRGVDEDVSKMIAKHLKVSGIFNDVTFSPKATGTELVMTGKIKRFEGFMEEIKADSNSGTGGAIAGVIYDLLHKNDKVEMRGAVELVDIQIRTSEDNKLIWEGEVKEEMKETVNWGDKKMDEFSIPENLLKKAVEDMIKKIEVSEIKR
jgi:hypothetical protein